MVDAVDGCLALLDHLTVLTNPLRLLRSPPHGILCYRPTLGGAVAQDGRRMGEHRCFRPTLGLLYFYSASSDYSFGTCQKTTSCLNKRMCSRCRRAMEPDIVPWNSAGVTHHSERCRSRGVFSRDLFDCIAHAAGTYRGTLTTDEWHGTLSEFAHWAFILMVWVGVVGRFLLDTSVAFVIPSFKQEDCLSPASLRRCHAARCLYSRNSSPRMVRASPSIWLWK